MGKIIVGKTADISPGKMIKVSIDGKDVMVANIDGNYCAKVICGWHKAEFDCKTGKLVKFPAKIRDVASYNVSIESDNVFVEM